MNSFLKGMNSLILGMARLLDFAGTLNANHRIKNLPDAQVTRQDWQTVGDDMRKVIHDLDTVVKRPR